MLPCRESNPYNLLKSIKNPDLTLRDRVRRLLGARGETIRDLAQAIGVHENYVHRILSSPRPAGRNLVRMMARHLGVSVTDLCGQSPEQVLEALEDDGLGDETEEVAATEAVGGGDAAAVGGA